MNPTYIIYLLTFLVFPFLGFNLSKYFDIDRSKKYIKWMGLIFTIHNFLFFFGFSINGDYPDYFIFSLEYLFLSFAISILYKSTNVYSKIFRIIGTVVLVVGFLQGLIGIFLFIVFSQNYETDKIYNFKSNGKDYQTRRYSYGFATLDDTKYTFETYRKYNYLPFEKLINKTVLYGTKSDLDFEGDNFSVKIKDNSKKQILEFSSTNGKKYKTTIE
jgi:hypothetical protein